MIIITALAPRNQFAARSLSLYTLQAKLGERERVARLRGERLFAPGWKFIAQWATLKARL